MVDKETDSLWSHLLGKSMRGELKDTQLETLPGTILTWSAWKKAYPKTTVLAMNRTAREFVKAFQEKPGRFVLGLRTATASVAYPFEVLEKERVVNDTFEKDRIVILYDRTSTGGRAYSSRVADRQLTFEWKDGGIVDAETGSKWDFQGLCLGGQLQGKQLQEVPAIPSFTKAWRQFYPETRIYGGMK